MSIIETHEITCDYAIIDTGYTSRLIETFSDPGNRKISEDVTVVCILDELWGKKNKNAWASWATKKETDKLKAMLTSLDLDGVIVLKLNTKKSPLYASSYFHSEYGSNTANRYCGCFYGIPDAISVFEHEGLGTIAYLVFDAESG